VVAFEDDVVDLAVLHGIGLVGDGIDPAVFCSPHLNALLAQGPEGWRAVRRDLRRALLDPGALPAGALVPLDQARLALPVAVGDFVDGYGGLHHATNMGRILRPDGPPLQPNWRHLPVSYHGRAATVVPSGTPIVRPRGQVMGEDGPHLVPTARLDIELEVGCVVGVGSELGRPVPIDAAADHLFGVVLLNDWSARDVQAFEYQPLGPFLAKSFATSVSHWVVTLDALEPYLVGGLAAAQEPAPLPYLRRLQPALWDLQLEVCLQTAAMRAAGQGPAVLSRTSFAESMYWSAVQQVAHATANGAALRPGDLFGSGTVSGPDDRHQAGSLMELSWGASRPVELPNGETRTFLEDGDTVVLRGGCGGTDQVAPTVALGEVAGTIVPAQG
jgi:fumarylacetoacetase